MSDEARKLLDEIMSERPPGKHLYKLTVEQVRLVREMWVISDLRMPRGVLKELAKRWGVSDSTIRNAMEGYTYDWVQPNPGRDRRREQL